MANKAFYVKKLDHEWELCMVYGYVGDNKYHLFIRKIDNTNVTHEIGTFNSKEAIDIWESYNLGGVEL